MSLKLLNELASLALADIGEGAFGGKVQWKRAPVETGDLAPTRVRERRPWLMFVEGNQVGRVIHSRYDTFSHRTPCWEVVFVKPGRNLKLEQVFECDGDDGNLASMAQKAKTFAERTYSEVKAQIVLQTEGEWKKSI